MVRLIKRIYSPLPSSFRPHLSFLSKISCASNNWVSSKSFIKNDRDNMLGMVQSLKDFMQRVSPTDYKEPFVSYKTNKTKVHYYETPSGIVFVLTTDPSVGDIRKVLQELHKTVWVEYVVKNPLCDWKQPITSNLFREKVTEYIKLLPCYQWTHSTNDTLTFCMSVVKPI